MYKDLIKKGQKLLLAFILSCGMQTLYAGKINMHVKNGGNPYTLIQITDEQGIPNYYYRDFEYIEPKQVFTFRIYWDLLGNYHHFELPDGVELYKVNNNPFTENDYKKLHEILMDTASDFGYCNYDELSALTVERQYYGVDAISGATKPAVHADFVSNAIKITYHFWQATNGNTRKQLISLTEKYFARYSASAENAVEGEQFNSKIQHADAHEQIVILYYSRLKTDDEIRSYAKENMQESKGCTFNLLMQILRDTRENVSEPELETLRKRLDSRDIYTFYIAYNYCMERRLKKELKTVPLRYNGLSQPGK